MHITVRPANERGKANLGWLDSKHSFSFGSYHDPSQMGFGVLRVINEDRVAPSGGFATHGHSDMEIISYVLEGGLEHKDSLGTGSVIRPGDVQRMTAGTGVRHSEYNASASDPVHFLQIWIIPERKGLAPSYEQKHFSVEERRGRLRLIGTPKGEAGAITIHQDVGFYCALLEGTERASHRLEHDRQAWVQVARGSLKLNGEALMAGDGAAITGEGMITLEALGAAEVLLFDLAA